MTRLFKVAAATLAVATLPLLVAKSEAAPRGDSKSEYCNMAKSQRNPVSWNAHYNCLDRTAAAAPIERKQERHVNKNPFCDMAKSQRNPVSWNQHYNCLSQR